MFDRPLVHRNKTFARVLLYLSPVLLVAVAYGVIALANHLGIDLSWHDKDYSQYETVQMLRDYLRINTTYVDGDELAGAEFLAEHLERAGVEVTVERVGEHNAAVWAILEGRDPGLVVLHNHIDTEPVLDPGAWRHPPFEGVIDGPFLFGRGAFDMKSLAIAQLMAFLSVAESVAESGTPPEHSLMFLATGDEELGSWLGARHWIRQHPELVGRIEAVLTEGGAIEAVELGDVKYWGTEIGQKYFADLWVCDASRERLELLREQIVPLAEGELRVPSPEMARFLRAYGPSRSRLELRQLLADPEKMLDRPESRLLTRRIRALLHNNLAVFPVEPAPGGGWQMKLILHLVPGVTVEEGLDELLPDHLFGFTSTLEVQHPPVPFSPQDHRVYQVLEEAMADLRPEAPHGPLVIPWSSSDARFFRTLGIPAYGFWPFVILSGDASRMRSANERIALPPLIEGADLYVEVVKRLVGS